MDDYRFKVSDNAFRNEAVYTSLEEAKKDWDDSYYRLNFRVVDCNDMAVAHFTTANAVDEYCEKHNVITKPSWEETQLIQSKADLPDTNLKTVAAQNKPKLSDVPPIALFALGAAMSDGATKYGRFNWRETGTTASVFYDAMMRHLVDWYNGEEYADDSKINHLAHIMASCAILLDSQKHEILNDDRNKRNTDSISRNPQHWKLTS